MWSFLRRMPEDGTETCLSAAYRLWTFSIFPPAAVKPLYDSPWTSSPHFTFPSDCSLTASVGRPRCFPAVC